MWSTDDGRSLHWLRMPVPAAGKTKELFIFSGVAVFDGIKGTGSAQWLRGEASLDTDYSNVIPRGKAIELDHWTVDVHLASIFNANKAVNTGWAVDAFRLDHFQNPLGGGEIAVANGRLEVIADVAVRDSDAFIFRLSYNVAILGKVVDYRPPIVE